MTLVRSLRGQFILLLFALALPVGGIGLIWVDSQDRLLRNIREQSIFRSADLVAEKLAYLIKQPSLPLWAFEQDGEETMRATRCEKMATGLLSRSDDYLALEFYRGGEKLCTAMRPGVQSTDQLEMLRTDIGLAPSGPVAVIAPPEPGGLVTVASKTVVGPAGIQWTVLGILDSRALDRVLDAGLSPEVAGFALQDARGNVFGERHDNRIDAAWLSADSRSRDRGHYMMLPATDIGGTALIGLDPAISFGQVGFLSRRATEILLIALVTLAAAAWLSDRLFLRWIIALRNLAQIHSVEQSAARFGNPAGVPLECSQLGWAIDQMADNAVSQAAFLNTVGAEKLKLLEELNHRVGNNFQVLESLLSLQRAAVSAVHKEDVRFIDEHLHAVAVAHRLSFASGSSARADLQRLLAEIVNGLRLSAELSAIAVELGPALVDIDVSVDDAIAFALYLAVTLPPYLDKAKMTGGRVKILTDRTEDGFLWVLSGVEPAPEPAPFIRQRLAAAYLQQLGGKSRAGDTPQQVAVFFPRREQAGRASAPSNATL